MINKSHWTRTLLVFVWIFIGLSGPPCPVCQGTTSNLHWQGDVRQKWGAHWFHMFCIGAIDSICSQSSRGQMMLSMVCYEGYTGALIGKDLDVRKEQGQEEKGATEDKKVGCHHPFSGREFAQTPADSEGQGSLTCCCPWGHKESDVI